MSRQTYNGYCHMTPGRLRVRVTNLKGRRVAAKSLELLMLSQIGVKHVRASSTTGNVLVCFTPDMISGEMVLQSLVDLGHFPLLSEKEDRPPQETREWLSEIGLTLGRKIAIVALKQALIGCPAAVLIELL